MAHPTTRVEHVVVDSGAFIRNAPLQSIGQHVITIQDVVSEIKDKVTKERLQVLPYQLQFREPSHEAIKIVTEFSKRTGDYPSLSAVDIRVLALTYHLEKEHVGTEHIKTVPDRKITWTATKGHLEKPTEIAGFYLGKKVKPATSTQTSESTNNADTTTTDEVRSTLEDISVTPKEHTRKDTTPTQSVEEDASKDVSGANISSSQTTEDTEAVRVKADCVKESQPAPTPVSTNFSWASIVKKPAVVQPAKSETESATVPQTDISKNADKPMESESVEESEKCENCAESSETDSAVDISSPVLKCLGEGDVLQPEDLDEEDDDEESEDEEEDEEEDDDDEEADEEDDTDGGWITPSNIKQVKAAMGDVNSEPARVPVGCVTTDFSMQNVLIQMGLNVISVDGMLIKRAKSYVLRCYGCHKLSTNMMRQFCHHCGNKTLQKVAMTVNDDGSIRYFLSRRRAFHIRGTKFSLPMPKGGKHAVNPILCEDQQTAHQRMAGRSKVQYDVLDPNYVVHTSPFAPIDTQSRSAQLGIRDFKHAFRNKRNPNEKKKLYGRRK